MDFPWNKLRSRTVDGIAGLYMAVAVDFATDKLLMLAFTNREAIEKTLEQGVMHYYSTSRKRIWRKGESSGNIQRVEEIYVDCDGDALLFKVRQKGGACHMGYLTCFFRKLDSSGRLTISEERVFDPGEVYKK